MRSLLLASVTAIGLAVSSVAAHADVIQSTVPAGADSRYYDNGWNWQFLGGVTLAAGTSKSTGLTSTATLMDQGWGGQTYDNGVKIGLFSNNTLLAAVAVAGASHSWTTQTYNIANDLAGLNRLNTALAGIDWSSAPTIEVEMFTTPYAWGGWELHVRDASFTVSSVSEVPAPAALGLLTAGLAGLGVARRRKVAAAA